MNIFDNFELGH